jgi:hypothetical protein
MVIEAEAGLADDLARHHEAGRRETEDTKGTKDTEGG